MPLSWALYKLSSDELIFWLFTSCQSKPQGGVYKWYSWTHSLTTLCIYLTWFCISWIAQTNIDKRKTLPSDMKNEPVLNKWPQIIYHLRVIIKLRPFSQFQPIIITTPQKRPCQSVKEKSKTKKLLLTQRRASAKKQVLSQLFLKSIIKSVAASRWTLNWLRGEGMVSYIVSIKLTVINTLKHCHVLGKNVWFIIRSSQATTCYCWGR